jgi:hypothetical protein
VIGRRREVRHGARSVAHHVLAIVQEEQMLSPIVIGAHPKRHEQEPIELGLMVSRLTLAPMDVVGTFWFDTTPHRAASDEYGRLMREDVQQSLERAVGDRIARAARFAFTSCRDRSRTLCTRRPPTSAPG